MSLITVSLGNVIFVGCDVVKIYINILGDLMDRKTHSHIKHPTTSVKYADDNGITKSHREEYL